MISAIDWNELWSRLYKVFLHAKQVLLVIEVAFIWKGSISKYVSPPTSLIGETIETPFNCINVLATVPKNNKSTPSKYVLCR